MKTKKKKNPDQNPTKEKEPVREPDTKKEMVLEEGRPGAPDLEPWREIP